MNSGELIKIVSGGIGYTPKKSIKQRSKYLRHRRRQRFFITKLGVAGIQGRKTGEALRRAITPLRKMAKIMIVGNPGISSMILKEYFKNIQPEIQVPLLGFDEMSSAEETREALLQLCECKDNIDNDFHFTKKKPPHHAKKKTFYFGRG